MSKITRVVLATFFIVGCSADLFDVVREGVVAASSKPEFVLGEQVFVSIQNTSNQPLFLNSCYADLEHRESGTWRLIGGRGCFDGHSVAAA